MNLDPRVDLLCIDCETCSAADIGDGSDAYASHPSTRLRCAVVALTRSGEAPLVAELGPDDACPEWARAHVAAGGAVLAHNANFEQALLRRLPAFASWPPVERWCDTAQIAAALSLPTSLKGLGRALGLAQQKDTTAHKLMMRLSDPAAIPTEAEAAQLMAYCRQDVMTTLEAWQRLRLMEHSDALAFEAPVRDADREINARGVYLDVRFADVMQRMVHRRVQQLDTLAVKWSEGDMVTTQPAPLKRHLADAGVATPDGLDVDAVAALLADPKLPVRVHELLRVRREAGRATSLKKLARITPMLSADGRLRYSLRYCGAHTGRWTSGGMQLHNLPKNKLTPEYAAVVRAAVGRGDLEAVKEQCSDVLQGLSYLLRSVVAAPPGYELIGGDYSAIEARVLAWLAGQQDVLSVFASGADIYTRDAEALGSTDRQLGKVARLALGYGMGPVKFRDSAKVYGVDLSLAHAAKLTRAWRESNPGIVQFWHAMEAAFAAALAAPGVLMDVGKLQLIYTLRALWIVLPSGRRLAYWRPRMHTGLRFIGTVDERGALVRRAVETTAPRYFTEAKNRKDMTEQDTYGGKLAENVTQAVARDLLAAALVRLRQTPYEVVLHVHDSIAAEVPEGQGSVAAFCALMARSPAWAKGLPLAVSGYRGRYFKG